MSEVKKIATRDSYGAALVELAKDHPDVVVLDADLAAATKTGVFKKAYADRHFDCGIAESNMMATAAGMAAMGLGAVCLQLCHVRGGAAPLSRCATPSATPT